MAQQPSSPPIRVLVVDDSPAIREEMGRMLGLEDRFEVVGTADNAEAGIREARRLKPQVVLLDINMPGMDGLEALEHFQQVSPAIQVVIVSAEDQGANIRTAFQRHAFDFLGKPINSDNLFRTIERAEREYQRIASRLPPQEFIGILSPTGGVGKTMLAINLAAGLAAQNRKVVLVDASLPFGDAGPVLNISSAFDLEGAVKRVQAGQGIPPEEFLPRHESGFRLLPAPVSIAAAQRISGQDLLSVIEAIQTHVDLLVVDTAPGFHGLGAAVMREASRLVVATQPTRLALRDTQLLLRLMKSGKISKEKIALVLNRMEPTMRINAAQVGKYLGHPIAVAINEDPAIGAAINRARLVVDQVKELQMLMTILQA